MAVHVASIPQAVQNSSIPFQRVVSNHPAGMAGHEDQSSSLNMAVQTEGQPSHLKNQDAARKYGHTANDNIYILADVWFAAADLIQARSSGYEEASQHKCWADIQVDHGPCV